MAYSPGKQLVHEVCPAADAVPEEQSAQTLLPETEENVPGLQSEHCLDPT